MIRPLHRGLVGLTAVALGVGGLGLVPAGSAGAATNASTATAAAAPVAVDGAVFTWDLNNEATSGAFAPGTWNLMSAGRIQDPGEGGATLRSTDSGGTWSNGRPAGWSGRTGNVTVEDLQAGGSYQQATFAGTRTNTSGVNANVVGVRGETRLSFSEGTGTVDPTTGAAQIAWDGDATLLFYSGMTFFYLSDPVLDVAAGGSGTITATVGGYATSMDDPSAWAALPERQVTIATLPDVEVTESGFTTQPAYREVTYDAPAGATAQNRTAATWGAFPQSFVDFQQQVGQGSYWYSSGGAADPRKPANPLSVAYDASPAPRVQVSRTTFLPDGSQQVEVTGSGFDPAEVPATRPPLAGRSGGVYVAVGKFAPTWRPSDGAASSSRKTSVVRWAVPAADVNTVGGTQNGAIELTPEGTFSTVLTVDKAALDAAAGSDTTLTDYGIYTYPGGGAVNRSFETATPISFAAAVVPADPADPAVPAAATVAVSAPGTSFGQPSNVAVTVSGSDTTGATVPATGSVTLTRGGATVGTADLVGGEATFALGSLPAGTYALQASYAGSTAVAAGSATATARVAKARSATATSVVRKPTRRAAGTLRVTSTSPTTTPTGTAVITVRRAGKVVRQATVTLRSGTATTVLPKRRGTYRVVTTYAGTPNVTGSTRTITYRVR